VNSVELISSEAPRHAQHASSDLIYSRTVLNGLLLDRARRQLQRAAFARDGVDTTTRSPLCVEGDLQEADFLVLAGCAQSTAPETRHCSATS